MCLRLEGQPHARVTESDGVQVAPRDASRHRRKKKNSRRLAPTPRSPLNLPLLSALPLPRQHEIVPVQLVDAIAGLRHGSTMRCLRTLAKAKLIHHDNTR